jgi:hypothetical protein
MSNYTKSTNFATKDNLSPGDPLKIVRGTEIDTEFNNIATAIATKTDNASVAITGGTINDTTIGATTASTGAFTTLAASGAVTLSGGTANGVPYLNGSKVLTSGSSLVFDGTNLGVGTASPASKLSISGASGDSAITFFGSAGTPVGYMGSTSVGNYIIGALANETFIRSSVGTAFSSDNGASVQMRLNTSGNLGIGVASPAYKLDVNGTAGISGNVTLSGGTANGVAYLNGSKVVTSGSALTFDGQTLTNTCSTPILLLNDTATSNLALRLLSTGGVSYIQSGISGGAFAPLAFTSNGGVSEQMRLNSTGLGIGTTSPTTKLSITDSTGPIIRMVRTSNRFEVSADTDFMSLNARDASTYINFKTADTERARIDSSGNLIQTVNTTAATLSTNGTLTFSIVDNSTLRISVRGSDGTTRTATVALT